VTAIADAYMDSVPLVAITGQVFSTLMGTDAFQEADIVGITMPITKHSFLVKDAEEIPGAIAAAFEIASTGRPVPCSWTSRRTRSRPKCPSSGRRATTCPATGRSRRRTASRSRPRRPAANREEARAVRRWRRHPRGASAELLTLAETTGAPSSRR
jgi:acetolactate synthase-1/2/3 large subunit